MRWYLFLAMATLVLSIAPFLLVQAFAHTDTFPNRDCGHGLMRFYNLPEIQHFPNKVQVVVCANDNTDYDISFLSLTAPDGNIYNADLSKHTTHLPPNTCHAFIAPDDFPGLPWEPGTYQVYLSVGTGDFVLTTLVVPESPIGLIALVGASLGSLGLYAKVK